MNAKQYLQEVNRLNMLIENKLIERNQWRDIALGITGDVEREKVQTSGTQQKMAVAVERYVDIENEINEYIDLLYEVKKDVLQTIEQLSSAEYQILHKVYIQGIKRLADVALECGKSYSWTQTNHKIAVRKVQQILDDRKKEGLK